MLIAPKKMFWNIPITQTKRSCEWMGQLYVQTQASGVRFALWGWPQPLCKLEAIQPGAAVLCTVWEGPTSTHTFRGASCEQVLPESDCRAHGMALHTQPFSRAFPTRHGRDVRMHTAHPHQGQAARKKDKAKTSKTAPPRKVSSLDSLALAFLLASAPCSSRCQEWPHPVVILVVRGLYFITFAQSPPKSIT